MKDIRIDVGVDTYLSVDIGEYVIAPNESIVFTIKNAPFARTEAIVEREFKNDPNAPENKVFDIYITPEESVQILDNAEYDFNKVIRDETTGEVLRRLKITDNGKVKLRKGVGGGIT